MCSMVIGQSSKIIGTPIKIGKLEVAQNDFPKVMNWNDAVKACADLGSDWRLPTKDELKLMYYNRDEIGGFARWFYWSSTESPIVGRAWLFNLSGGYDADDAKSATCSVRAVSSLISSEKPKKEASNSYSYIIGKPFRIGKLEVAQSDFPKTMNWDEAVWACANLGSGWRLPTKDELNLMYLNKDKLGVFDINAYWSSTEGNKSFEMWEQYFSDGDHSSASTFWKNHVRGVRSF